MTHAAIYFFGCKSFFYVPFAPFCGYLFPVPFVADFLMTY